MKSPTPLDLANRLLSDRPLPGQRWQNWKSPTIYTVVGLFQHTERDEEEVCYTDGIKNWARPIEHFLGFVEDAGCWRFSRVD